MGRRPAPATGPEWYRELVEAWFRSLARRGRARKTERTYGSSLRDLGRWLEHCRVERAEDLIPAVLYAWQDSLVSRQLAPGSRGMAASAVRGLLRWAGREKTGIREGLADHVETVEKPDTLPRALEPEQLAKVMDHYAPPGRGLDRARDRALFLFLLTTGSRITAALSLELAQARGRLQVVQKGGGEHTLVQSATARVWLEHYLRLRGRDDQPALWIRIGPRGRHRLTPDRANAIWAELCRKLRIEPAFTSHAIRHTSATELGERGVSDTEMAKHMGWKGNAMAMRYRDLRATRRQQLVDQLDDLVPAVPAEPAPPARRRPASMRVIRGKGTNV